MAQLHERFDSEHSRSSELLQQMEAYPRVFFLETGQPGLRHVIEPLGNSFKQNVQEAKKRDTSIKPHFLVVKGEPVSGKSHMLKNIITPYFEAENIPVQTLHWEQVMHALHDVGLIQTDLRMPLAGHENSLVSGFLALHAGLGRVPNDDLPSWENIQNKIIRSPVIRFLGRKKGESEEEFFYRMKNHVYTKANFDATKEILGYAPNDALMVIEVPGGTSFQQYNIWTIPSRAYAPSLIHDMVYGKFPFEHMEDKVVGAVGAVGDPIMEYKARQRSKEGDEGATPTQIIKARAAAEAAVYILTRSRGETLPRFVREIVGSIPLNDDTATVIFSKQAEEYRKASDKIAEQLHESPDIIFRAVCYRLAVAIVLQNELCLEQGNTRQPDYASVVHVKPETVL
jgi:hypothetical protein